MNIINGNVAMQEEYLYNDYTVEKEIVTTKQLTEKDKNNSLKQNLTNVTTRIIDIIGSLVGLIITIPVTLMVILIKIISKEKGPIFYTHYRIGKDGKLFKMYKFRTMVVGADEILAKYLAENEEARKEYEKNKKLKNDPRVTKVGKFLRKTSLDEFPQFLNVLIGDMSLVGPRPYLEREKKDMGNTYNYIIQTKPGITGLWQVSGRSDVTFDERMELDIKYNKTKTLGKDIKILFKTLGKILKKEGAV